MTETEMFRHLRNKLTNYSVRIKRIETGQKLPDLFFYFLMTTINGWIEMKHVSSFEAKRIKPTWEPGQVRCLQEMYNSGCHVWLLLASDDQEQFCFIHGAWIQKEYEDLKKFWKQRIKQIEGKTVYDILAHY